MRRILLGLILAAAVVSVAVPAGSSATKDKKPYSITSTIKGHGAVHVGEGTIVGEGKSHLFPCTAFPTATAVKCYATIKVGTGTHLSLRAIAASGWKFASWTGCHSTTRTCKLSLPHKGQVTATFVSPGNRLNPYPLGTPVTLNHPNNAGWRMTVNSATINANAQVEAVNGNAPPPAGHQYTLVNLTVTLLNGGPTPITYLMAGLLAATHDHASTPFDCTPPSPDISSAGTVNSGQTETGNLCFEIVTNDASKLMLSAIDEVTSNKGISPKDIWFALY